MKKIFYLLSITFLMLQSCSSGDSDSTPVVQDNIKPPYTVRYEVKFSPNATFPQNFRIWYASQINDNFYFLSHPSCANDIIYHINFSGFWTRSFTVTVNDNPLQTGVNTEFNPSKETDVNFKIFINDVLMENSTVKISPNPNPGITALHGTRYNVY